MRRNNYFEIEISAECETLSDTNYGSNYNEIFQNNGLELNKQILPINELDTQLDSELSSKTDYEDRIDKLFQDDDLFNDTPSH